MTSQSDETEPGGASDARVEAWVEQERQTRRDRPSTRTLGEAARVFASYASPRLIVALGVFAIVGRLMAGPLAALDLAILGGVAVFWPLQEWAAHRWILHMKPVRGWLPMFARSHRAHHQNPSDFTRTLLPPAVPVQAFVAFGAATWVVTRRLDVTFTVLAGLAGAALAYEWVHYLTHTDYRPRSSWFRRIWRNHRMHHYRNEGFWYAFTVPHVDAWFGTDPDDADLSATTRTL